MIYMWHSGMLFSYQSVFRSAKAFVMASFSFSSLRRWLGLLLTLSETCSIRYFSLVTVRKVSCVY